MLSETQPTAPEALTQQNESDCQNHWQEAAQNDPDLRAVVEAWPTLPAAVKAGVVALVRASTGEQG